MKKAVLVMPDAAQLRGALRTIRHIHGAEMALVLPPTAQHLADIAGLAQVLTWAKEAGKDVTLIGGTPAVRAEAVADGWRVSTSLEEWESWLAEAQGMVSMRPSDSHGWRIFRSTAAMETPAIELATLTTPAANHPTIAPADIEHLASDEQHEDAVIALIWQTGKLSDIPQAFYGD